MSEQSRERGEYEKAQQEDNPDEESHHSFCSITLTRRLFRIILLLAIVSVLVAVPLLLAPYLYTYKTVMVTASKGFFFELTNCKLYIGYQDSLSASEAVLDLDIPGIS